MRILIVGANGMLGTDVSEAVGMHELIRADINELDIGRFNDVTEFVGRVKPDAVINCAAYTNVDGCETEINTAYAANAIGPRNLAVACEKTGARLVHISTDYVFDGRAGRGYLEDDAPNPLSVYGKSKLAGENYVRSLTNKYYILRIQSTYGKNGKNFADTMLRLASEKKPFKVVDDQFSSPTCTKDLAGAIAGLIGTEAYGVYHLTNAGVVSWYKFALDIFEIMGVDADIIPCTTEEYLAEYPRPAKRPMYSALVNLNWELSGFKPLRNYKDALRDYLSDKGGRA